MQALKANITEFIFKVYDDRIVRSAPDDLNIVKNESSDADLTILLS